MSRDLLERRASEARGKIAYLSGETDRHPQGWSGARWIIPYGLDCDMWDTLPHAWRSSEWGNLAGMT